MIRLDDLAAALDVTLESLAESPTMTARDRAVVQVTAAALRLARDFAKQGHDPVAAIERIRAAFPDVAMAGLRAVDAAIRSHFPAKG